MVAEMIQKLNQVPEDYIYIYIKWTVFVNVTTKSAQHAHARVIAIIVEKKSKLKSFVYISFIKDQPV